MKDLNLEPSSPKRENRHHRNKTYKQQNLGVYIFITPQKLFKLPEWVTSIKLIDSYHKLLITASSGDSMKEID